MRSVEPVGAQSTTQTSYSPVGFHLADTAERDEFFHARKDQQLLGHHVVGGRSHQLAQPILNARPRALEFGQHIHFLCDEAVCDLDRRGSDGFPERVTQAVGGIRREHEHPVTVLRGTQRRRDREARLPDASLSGMEQNSHRSSSARAAAPKCTVKLPASSFALCT